jgi:hypothetical protein
MVRRMIKPGSLTAFLLVAVLAGVTSGCTETSTADASGADRATVAQAPSGDELFARSCEAFRSDEIVDVLLNGADSETIDRINEALALAESAADVDYDSYGLYAKSFRGFAESMGQLVAISNDPASTTTDVLKAARKVTYPDSLPECPPADPDSGGLPLPSESPS